MNNIIIQNYNDLLKKVIIDVFNDNLNKSLNNFNPNGNVMNYIDLLSNLDESLCIIAKESIITLFESLDRSFVISSERKSKYYIKSVHERTIMTIFGEITYKRHFFQSKLNNKLYCYVDRLLGFHKYDYFDPYLKSIVLEYAANNSMPKTAKYVNDLIGNRIKLNDSFNYLSRQTIRNIILNAKTSIIIPDIHQEIDTLYVIADEKWIHTQNNNHEDVMQKSIVIFEGINNHRLVNKKIFSSIDKSFLQDALDYVYYSYNTDKIKTVFLMGDGASWIKSLKYEFYFNKNIHVIYGLDKFHFKQAIHHICLNKDLEYILISYILNNSKDDFNNCCNLLIKNNPHRTETILIKQAYIISNWTYIHNLYKYNLSCPMESQISHNIADLFTSRPKAYSIKMINKLTELRLLLKNKLNIKQLFLHNFNSKEVLTINKDFINFDVFERKQNNNDFINLIPDFIYPLPFDSSYHTIKHFKT